MSTNNAEAIDYVLHSAQERDVKFIRLWFTDILGTLKGFAVTIDELEHVLHRGATFDGSAIDAFARSTEADMVAMPDPSTWQILPWRPRENAVARMFCDIQTPDGEAAETDSRNVLRRIMRRAADKGFTYYVGPELEYFYLEEPNGEVPNGVPNVVKPVGRGGYFDQTSADSGADLRRETVIALEEMGIPVQHSHHEVSEGQQHGVLVHLQELFGARVLNLNVATHAAEIEQVPSERRAEAPHPRRRADQIADVLCGPANAAEEGELRVEIGGGDADAFCLGCQPALRGADVRPLPDKVAWNPDDDLFGGHRDLPFGAELFV